VLRVSSIIACRRRHFKKFKASEGKGLSTIVRRPYPGEVADPE
jgi:hypothetical protein